MRNLPGSHSNTRTAFRSTDTNQKELIAKHVDRESAEIAILEYLRAVRPQSRHVHLDFKPGNPICTNDWSTGRLESLDRTPYDESDDGDMDCVDEESGSKESKYQIRPRKTLH